MRSSVKFSVGAALDVFCGAAGRGVDVAVSVGNGVDVAVAVAVGFAVDVGYGVYVG
jgi:hypothetical protein